MEIEMFFIKNNIGWISLKSWFHTLDVFPFELFLIKPTDHDNILDQFWIFMACKTLSGYFMPRCLHIYPMYSNIYIFCVVISEVFICRQSYDITYSYLIRKIAHICIVP